MGTNYYTKGQAECEDCGKKHACAYKIHLGKSSFGWVFTFAYNDGEYYKTEAQMRHWLRGRPIIDEYGESISYDDFWQKVDSKKNEKNQHPTDSPYVTVGTDGTIFLNGEFS